jgi:hypothetical protein
MWKTRVSCEPVGRKCDSVYLSTDDVWDISDVTITDSMCNSFSIAPRQSSIYGSSETIPPVALGIYKAIVRTRSTLRDVFLENNVRASLANVSVTPPQIALNEHKMLTLRTNQQLVLQMANITAAIAVTVKLATTYQLAYHSMFIKKDSPPSANDYDIMSKQLGTTQQIVSITTTRPGTYYVLIESYSVVPSEFYQVDVFVQEAEFEISTVFPSIIAQDQSVTVRLDGILFGINMLAFLTNSTIQIPATRLYRYTSEVAYATFNSVTVPAGNYSLTLYDADENRYCHLANAVTVSSTAPPGKLVVDLVAPDSLRAGTTTIIQVKVANSGYSDVEAKFLLLSTSGNTKLSSTDAEIGVLPSAAVAFIPIARDQPDTVVSARSILEFSFRLTPNSAFFSGNEPIRVTLLEDCRSIRNSAILYRLLSDLSD